MALLAVGPASAAAADPDWDGDGATTTDCAPLDPEVHPAAVDVPDLAFEESNCDGIDGDAANAVFVTPTGDDLSLGTRDQPVKTLARAVALAKDTGRDVYAAAGDYTPGLVVVGPGFDGFGLYGGYEPGTWARTRATATAITGSPAAALVQAASGVVLQLVRLTGTAPLGDGKSAYGLRASNASVALEEVTAEAGRGSDGTLRRDELKLRAPAAAENGRNSPSCTEPGAGGNLPAAFTIPKTLKGGAGGTGGLRGQPGSPGLPGEGLPGGAPGGEPGMGGTSAPDGTVHGTSGSPGLPGADGADGTGGVGGTPSSDGWIGAEAKTGTPGLAGTAGGGGGGGAGTQGGAGAGGGQGGHGGRRGLYGLGGGAGGGSFGTYLWQSSLVAIDSDIAGGDGGAGGKGGAGASGAEGGIGGTGGNALTTCGVVAGNGGAGGNGGNGGSGGDGGGGAGGPSAAVLREGDDARFARRDSVLTHGAPGAGGVGGGNATDGSAAVSEEVIGGEPAGDFDDDGYDDAIDPCPLQPGAATGCPARKPALSDADGDGIPDVGEDADSDGVPDVRDTCPAEPGGTTDANGDGCPDPPPPADPLPAPEPTPTAGTGQGGGTVPQQSSAVLSQPQPEQLAARVRHAVSMRGKRTRFTKLSVTNMPAGGTATVTCKGKKCPRKRWTVTATKAGTLTLAPFRNKWMPRGTKLEVTISKPGAVARITTYTLRAPKPPKVVTQCLPPGAAARVSCP